MKSLLAALFGFALVFYGCRDVPPFRALGRKIRRAPGRPDPEA